MACVGGTASAARLKRPKSSAQRGDGLRGRRHPQLGRAGEFAAQTNFPDAWGRMLVARPDFGRCPQHWRPPGAPHRSCAAASGDRPGWLGCVHAHDMHMHMRARALTKGLRPLFSKRGLRHNNNTQATPPVHACSTLTMPPAHRRQLRPTGAERPGLTKQKQDRRHLARRRIAARERQLTAGGGRPPPTGRAPPPPPAPPPAASPRRAAATRTTATCAPTRSSRRTRSR